MLENKVTTLQQLKANLMSMGGYVERALDLATQALINRNPELHKEIEATEAEINSIHVINDQACLNLLAKLSPFASDLRLILACYKMSNDLERMGDHAANISRGTTKYLERPEIPLQKDFLLLIQEAKTMVKDALDAFANKDIEKAQRVLEYDDVVDNLKDKMMIQMKELMKTNSSLIDSGVDLILFSKNLERIGDLATNIAEDVIFISSGQDVRHRGIAQQ